MHQDWDVYPDDCLHNKGKVFSAKNIYDPTTQTWKQVTSGGWRCFMCNLLLKKVDD